MRMVGSLAQGIPAVASDDGTGDEASRHGVPGVAMRVLTSWLIEAWRSGSTRSLTDSTMSSTELNEARLWAADPP